MRRLLASISLLLLSLLAMPASAATFPESDGDHVRYNAVIEMGRGYVSGVCILARDGETVRGCLFNEFGISALAFEYDTATDKVKLTDVIKMLNKWYIRRTLRQDLRQVMHGLADGVMTYRNEKRNINYKFTILENATEE